MYKQDAKKVFDIGTSARIILSIIRDRVNLSWPEDNCISLCWKDVYDRTRLDRDRAEECFQYLKEKGLVANIFWLDKPGTFIVTSKEGFDVGVVLAADFLQRSRDYLDAMQTQGLPVLKFDVDTGKLLEMKSGTIIHIFNKQARNFSVADYIYRVSETPPGTSIDLQSIHSHVAGEDREHQPLTAKEKKFLMDAIDDINSYAFAAIGQKILKYADKECLRIY